MRRIWRARRNASWRGAEQRGDRLKEFHGLTAYQNCRCGGLPAEHGEHGYAGAEASLRRELATLMEREVMNEMFCTYQGNRDEALLRASV